MKAIAVILFCWVIITTGSAQNFTITFSGVGATTQIDSVTATNLRTGQNVTLPGNETLILALNTGIPLDSELNTSSVVYPNPFSGSTTFSTIVPQATSGIMKVQDLFGRVISEMQTLMQPGRNDFLISLSTAGIYLITITCNNSTTGYKVICTDPGASGNRIDYLGTNPAYLNRPVSGGLKSTESTYLLSYSTGDIIHYRSMSGIYTTILTDTPELSKNYEVEFAACTDADGKNYSIVKIGDQTWMAENLAYLPAVSSSSEGSETSGNLYVYGYEGRSISDAKNNSNYSSYGVLYNWTAGMEICPEGWHLPVDAEWSTLSDFLGSFAGNKMKSQTGWTGSFGNGNNFTGFNAFPAGYRGSSGGFVGKGNGAYFLSASEEGNSEAWSRFLYYLSDGSISRIAISKSIGASVRCVKGSSLPTITTAEISGIKRESATCGGEVVEDGGSNVVQRGICWNKTGKPTILDQTTQDGNGTGQFKSTLSGLTIGTLYFVRAYASNSTGTAYGEERRFSTLGETGTFTDTRDGHEYNWVKIGDQTWMAENLAYLPSVSPSSKGSTVENVYYVYDFQGYDVDSAKATLNYSVYGVLYNSPAAMNGAAGSDSIPSGIQGACPPGWHLPSHPEWVILRDYLGEAPGKKLKETGDALWTAPNDGTNEVGFSARPSGARMLRGTFERLGDYAHFRGATQDGADKVKEYYLRTNLSNFLWFSDYKDYGDAIRCLKN